MTASSGLWQSAARGIELSGSGIVLDRGRELLARDQHLLMHLFITLPERQRPILAVARPVRIYGSQQALRFVTVSDVDRLCLAEHLDVVQRRGATLH